MVDSQGYEDVERMRKMYKDGAAAAAAAAQTRSDQSSSEYSEALPVTPALYDVTAQGDVSGVMFEIGASSSSSSRGPKKLSVKQKRTSLKKRSPKLPPKASVPKVPPKSVQRPVIADSYASSSGVNSSNANHHSYHSSVSVPSVSPRVAPRRPERRHKTDLGLPPKTSVSQLQAAISTAPVHQQPDTSEPEEVLPALPPKGKTHAIRHHSRYTMYSRRVLGTRPFGECTDNCCLTRVLGLQLLIVV